MAFELAHLCNISMGTDTFAALSSMEQRQPIAKYLRREMHGQTAAEQSLVNCGLGTSDAELHQDWEQCPHDKSENAILKSANCSKHQHDRY
eukprot:6193707-Pleurochrysis_carterae.AAC.3